MLELPDAGIRGWIHNTARANFWRVASWYELHDLVQDGYFCYYKCYARYHATLEPDPKNAAKQMMGATQVAFMNHITTLAQKRTAVHEFPVSQLMTEGQSEEALWDKLLPAEGELGSLGTILANAPAEIVQLMQALLKDLTGYKRQRSYRRAIRETTNEYYCRLMGVDPKTTDLKRQVDAYFQP